MTTTKTRKTTTEKPIETLPTNPFTFEILALASKQKSNAKKSGQGAEEIPER